MDPALALSPLSKIPSPSQSVWHLGGIPIRGYALCIVLGIVAACVVTELRMRRRGAPPNLVLDIAVYAVPAGIIGARIYHVITSPEGYFGSGGDPWAILRIWEGGLGVWGSVAGGAVGALIACRRFGVPLRFVADALAPGLPLAQAIGRWGNYLNNELYGRTTKLPWGVEIYDWDGKAGQAVTETGSGEPIVKGVYHPTFLYEFLWDIGVAVLVWLLDRRYRFGRGRAFALYAMAYCAGRFWIEAMRSDEAQHFLGMRLNNWTALLVFAGALVYFLRVRGPQERLSVAEDGTISVLGEGEQAPAAEAGDAGDAAESGDDAGAVDASGGAEGEAERDDGGTRERDGDGGGSAVRGSGGDTASV